MRDMRSASSLKGSRSIFGAIDLNPLRAGAKMTTTLTGVIKHDEDLVMIIYLGLTEGLA